MGQPTIVDEIQILRDLEEARVHLRTNHLTNAKSEVGGSATPSHPDSIARSKCLFIIEDAIDRPVYWAIRLQAREVGWMLYCKGGLALMSAALYEMTPSFGAALDKWWHGVGFESHSTGVWMT